MQEENQKLKECPSTNMQKSIGQPSDNEETEFEEVEEGLSNEIIQHPDAFTRVLDRPEIQEIVVAHHAFQGPLPPPYLLRGYQDILPDAPERIFQLTEKEFAHRQKMEEKALDGAINRDKRGQWFGLSATIFTVACATLLGLTGHEVLAGTVIGTVVAVAGIFVLRQKPSIKKKSEDNKPEEK
ncbi:DUF2335 domain-containing protein [Escherichia coli]|uniref:DUF2335 domain-containing protein n=3 Tax=Escherichia coli TaxID=562 RepID=A0A0A1AD11_ECOLX|nr:MULTISPECIES: DUF2335 domain-containing protein [Enterobacteriaceae]EFE8618217.1 DUF2335 domain-containing protein [Escherichia coli O103]EFN7293573.1 DUF2335 domain-containing protein [Escherichia coli O2:H6]EFY0631704.1 DUF2335 domain-containing protein [Shigella flexneri]ELO0572798.1 DUF2335 domain-containing protein [Escherichia coli O2]MCZ9059267.1 DUF2335 domain-containing protein [Escherichia albertii]MDZ3934470.1 DUF2335 domain-containing protein [Escherichia marmotae]HBN3539613.1